jgi:hypothetical protein
MRYLTTLLFAALSLNAVGQGIPQLPYNPDATGDEFIGSPDLLELLALYGEEFSSAILSEDQESAIVSMGYMVYPLCHQACDNLTGFWSIATLGDLGLVWDEIGPGDVWLKQESLSPITFLSNYNLVDVTNINYYLECYCVTKELPKVEYSYCNEYDGSLDDCITSKVQDGWYPLGGLSASGNYSYITQAFWRWAE